jgi:HlyD family secretion protein
MNAAATPPHTATELHQLLGDDAPPPPWWRQRWVWAVVLVLALLAGGGLYWKARQPAQNAPNYVTEPLHKGSLTLKVSANGTLQPTRSVSIGSELSGTVKVVRVDVNDRVKKGQVLVELDTDKLQDQVQGARAALAAAQAQLALNSATVKEAQANLARMEEVARLSGGKVPAATELDTARATRERAVASEASARAAVAEAQSTLSTNLTNFSKASIRSPINGVVLSRSVDPGNAVAASLQAVTLFTIAEDLTQLRLEASVDEADVGAVQVGQKASFTVSAYPSRRYPAKITRVAYGSTKTDNVVTYTTYLDVDNTDLSLRPGMTAAATIVATERNDVLLVPNTALRFTPTQAGATKSSGSIVSSLTMAPRPSGSGQRKVAGVAGRAGGTRQIWVLKDGQAQAISVTTGISDGRMTEVSGPELQEGMAIITDQRSAGAAP